MALSPRVIRRERIEVLNAEIDDLVTRYTGMPPGRAQDAVTAAIDAKFDEIDLLNEPHVFEKPLGRTLARSFGVLCVLFGLVVDSYGTLTFGIFVLLACAFGAMNAPTASEKNIRTWRP